jgi:hypothetical protein
MVEKFRLRPFGLHSWVLVVVSSIPFGLVLGAITSKDSPVRFLLVFLGGVIVGALFTTLSLRFSWQAALYRDELRVNLGGRRPELRIPYGAIERVLWDDRQAVVLYRGEKSFGSEIVTRNVKLHVEAPQVFADRLTHAIERAALNPESASPSIGMSIILRALAIGAAVVALVVIVVSLLG